MPVTRSPGGIARRPRPTHCSRWECSGPTPPAAAATGSDVVFSVVTNGKAVEAVTLGEHGIIVRLSVDAVYLDMSTIDPEISRAVGTTFAERGLAMLDAPLSGSPVTIAAGSASTMVGGDRAAYDKVESLLHDIGSKVSYIGPSGTAVQMKVAINLALIVEMVVFCESVALAEKGGSTARSPSTPCSRAWSPRR